MRIGAPQLLQIRSSGCQDRVDRVTGETFQEAESHPVVALEMTDLRLHGSAALATLFFRSRQIARTASRQMHAGFPRIIMAAIAFVDVRVDDAHASRLFDRGNVWMAFTQVDTHDLVGSFHTDTFCPNS